VVDLSGTDEANQSKEPINAEKLLREIHNLRRPPLGNAQAKDE